MRIYASPFWLPKEGNSRKEYEDAFFPRERGQIRTTQASFGVADGASEGIFSGWWAQILATSFCQRPDSDFDEALREAHRRWRRRVGRYIGQRRRSGRPLRWYEESALQSGAFASLLVLSLDDLTDVNGKPRGTWSSVAVGDSCLFQTRGRELVARFPLNSAAEFGNRPLLIASRPERNGRMHDSIRTIQGEWRSNDRFYLMTDAIAGWFLAESEAGGTPWDILANLNAAAQIQTFADLIADLRARHAIRNDDVTVVRIDID